MKKNIWEKLLLDTLIDSIETTPSEKENKVLRYIVDRALENNIFDELTTTIYQTQNPALINRFLISAKNSHLREILLQKLNELPTDVMLKVLQTNTENLGYNNPEAIMNVLFSIDIDQSYDTVARYLSLNPNIYGEKLKNIYQKILSLEDENKEKCYYLLKTIFEQYSIELKTIKNGHLLVPELQDIIIERKHNLLPEQIDIIIHSDNFHKNTRMFGGLLRNNQLSNEQLNYLWNGYGKLQTVFNFGTIHMTGSRANCLNELLRVADTALFKEIIDKYSGDKSFADFIMPHIGEKTSLAKKIIAYQGLLKYHHTTKQSGLPLDNKTTNHVSASILNTVEFDDYFKNITSLNFVKLTGEERLDKIKLSILDRFVNQYLKTHEELRLDQNINVIK